MSKHTTVAEWLKSWWFLILFGVSLLGGLITMWFELQFVIKAVNPEAIATYQVEQAVKEQKQEIRWCVQKLLMAKDGGPRLLLECTD